MARGKLRNALCLAFLLASGAGTAQGAMLYTDTLLATGPEFLTSIEVPAMDVQGDYKVTLTDFKWFNTPAQALSFGVFTASGAVKTLQGAGTLEFFKGPGKVSLLIYARPGGTRLTDLLGLSVENTAAVVALPSSLLLLASARGGSALLKRRRQLRDALGAMLLGGLRV